MTHNPFAQTPDTDDETFEVNAPEGDGPKQLDPGPYPARVIELTKEVSKAGNPMFVFIVTLTGNEWYAGKEFKLYCAQTEAAMFKTNETLLALDLAKVENGIVKAKFKKSDAIGKDCTAIIALEEGQGQYAGRMFPRLKSIQPPKGTSQKAPF